jgi:hypothetical protein
MSNRIRGAHAVALAVLAIAAPAAAAAPVSVNLRVEGRSTTIFDGPVTTDGHTITTPSGGTHPCDGTNNAAHPAPVPTATAALDDGARLNNLSWDADWFDSFNDFIVKDVNGERATSSEFWGFAVNFRFASEGGCQTKVNQGDEVLWIFDAFSKTHVLKLAGPSSATTGAPVTVQVTDGGDGSPQANASVGGAQTAADGRATLSFANPGVYRLKADRADSVRSNTLTLCVDPPGADPCTSGDKTAPGVQVSLPGSTLASERARSRTLDVSWQADDGAGAGVSHYGAEVRELGQADWKPIADRTQAASVRFRGESGKAYQFRVTAVDRAANRGTAETAPLVLPVDDRDRRLWRFSRRWKRLPKGAAWGRTVMRTRRSGARATFPFTGRRVALIGRELPRGGRLRVSVEGRSKVLRLRGRPAARSVLWTSRRLDDGAHTLRIQALGGGPVELDAVAPLP